MMPAFYHYDCDIKQSNENDKSELEKCIDIIIKKEGYLTCDVEKNNIITDGGNYLGNLYDVNIKGKTKYGETPLFIKAMTPDSVEMVISLDSVYNKELFAYTEILSAFDRLQDKAQVPKDERFKHAKFYEESLAKTIILENMARKGFRTWFRMDCVSLDMAEACFKQLARFHSLSFVLKVKETDFFHDKIMSLEQPFIFNENWNAFCSKFTKTAIDYLDEDLRNKVKKNIERVVENFTLYYKDDDLKWCGTHGDYRPNNIMIKETNGRITDAIPVDYQLLCYGCPIFDLLYFLYTGTDLQFRRKYFTYLKDLYFETLKKFLEYFDVAVESVYPRKVFENQLMEKREYGLAVLMIVGPFIYVCEGEAPDISKDKMSDVEMTLDERFKDRITEAIEEFIELGIL